MTTHHVSHGVCGPDPRQEIAKALQRAKRVEASFTVTGALFDSLIEACGSLRAARDWLRVQVNAIAWPTVIGRREGGLVAVEVLAPSNWKPNRVKGWVAVHNNEIRSIFPDIDL